MVHGYAADGQAMLRNTGMMTAFLERGYAVVAPDGQPMGEGRGRSWDFQPDRPADRDEIAFILAVAEDASARFALDRDQMLLAGFSIGGSMTSYLACAEPGAFAAYAPVAGSFWRPHPEACAGPVRLFHTHGRGDRTVPLEGRAIRPDFVQGNVFEAMEIWRDANACAAATENRSLGSYQIEDWTGCVPGSTLSFALHDGEHSIPKGWAPMVLDWFEALP